MSGTQIWLVSKFTKLTNLQLNFVFSSLSFYFLILLYIPVLKELFYTVKFLKIVHFRRKYSELTKREKSVCVISRIYTIRLLSILHIFSKFYYFFCASFVIISITSVITFVCVWVLVKNSHKVNWELKILNFDIHDS